MLWGPEEHRLNAWAAFERYIAEPGHAPTLAVRNDAMPASFYVNGRVDRYVRDHMRLFAVSDHFRVFAKR
jgi:hypothetical protein